MSEQIKPKIGAISLSWDKNFLQRKDQISKYSEYSGIECKVGETVEKLLKIGAEDEIAAYTNPEWLTKAEIDRKFKPRINKLAKAIGFDVISEKWVPRDGKEGSTQGTIIYKLKKNPALVPLAPKPKSDDELRQIGFNNAKEVKDGQVVEIRYTNSNEFFRKIGKVIRVNPRSIRVEGNYEFTHYFKANTINNGVFLIPEGRLEEITANVQKFMAAEKQKKDIINSVLDKVTWTCEPVIRVHDEFGNEVNSIDCFELAHPTTAESVKAHCQLQAASERENYNMAVLNGVIDKKLKEAGLKEL